MKPYPQSQLFPDKDLWYYLSNFKCTMVRVVSRFVFYGHIYEIGDYMYINTEHDINFPSFGKVIIDNGNKTALMRQCGISEILSLSEKVVKVGVL